MKFKYPKLPSFIFEDKNKIKETDRTYIYPVSSSEQIIVRNSNVSLWAKNTDYKVGNRCIYTDGLTYECVTDHTSGDILESTYWKTLNVQTELDSINDKFKVQTAVFAASAWVGDAAPYTQILTISKFTGSENPIATLNYPSTITADNAEDYEEAFSYISKIESIAGGLKATCMHDKPSLDVYVDIMG